MRPPKLDSDALKKWLDAHPAWEKTQAGGQEAIARTYKVADFSTALGLVVRVGLAAEKRDHHPDIELGWGRARVRWSTHDAAGVTALDLAAAEATDRLGG